MTISSFRSPPPSRHRNSPGFVEKVEKGRKSKIREQVLAAIQPSLDYAKKKKTVIATFAVDSGLSSGNSTAFTAPTANWVK